MDAAGYTTLTRQKGLKAELATVAHNIANLSTTGYRREGVIFSEYVSVTGGNADSVSMARAEVGMTDLRQGPLTKTGGRFDLAIEGNGFFQVETPDGPRLTRAGAFTPNAAGDLVTPDGHLVMDAGGAAIFIPPDATDLSIAADGTISAAGQPLGQIGLFQPTDPIDLSRQEGTMFDAPGGFEPVADSVILQGFLEGSNVDPVSEITRMIEVQRAYELGQSLLDREDQRLRDAIRTMGK